MDVNNDYECANNEIHVIKEKLKELDEKQMNEICEIENFLVSKAWKRTTAIAGHLAAILIHMIPI